MAIEPLASSREFTVRFAFHHWPGGFCWAFSQLTTECRREGTLVAPHSNMSRSQKRHNRAGSASRGSRQLPVSKEDFISETQRSCRNGVEGGSKRRRRGHSRGGAAAVPGIRVRNTTGSERRSCGMRSWGQELISITGHTDQIIDLAFSPDGMRVASQSRNGIIKVSEVQTGQLILTIKVGRQFQGNGCLAFSPDGKRLASSSRASGSSSGPAGLSEVKVFDAQTGQELLALKGHTATVSCIVYSRDGKRLASASGSPARAGPDGEVKVWDSRDGTGPAYPQRWRLRPSRSLQLYGHQLASDAGGAVKIYDATPMPDKP